MKIALATDGAELVWAEEGEGEPLLLIAGQSTGMDGWGPTATALAQHFRVIRFDHRGIGRSSRGHADRYTTRSFAADAVSVLQAAGAESAHVYGHSMGGRVGQWLAIDHPRVVRSLILAATTGGRHESAQRKSTAMAELLSGDISRMAPLFFDPDWTQQHPDEVRAFFESKASAWAKSRHFKASSKHDAWAHLGLVQSPTLILHGTDDALTPLWNGTLLHQHIRCSTLVRVQGARHGLHLDHPETRAWIRQFILIKGRTTHS